MLVDALSVVLRALSFLALFQAAGIAIFLAFFSRQLEASTAGIRRVGAIAAWIALPLILAHYALEPARMAGELAGMMNPTYRGMVTESSLSLVLALRLIGLALVLIGLRAQGKRPLGVLGAAFIAASFTLMGHTTTHANQWLLAAMLLIHLLVVAFWFGALVPLYRISSQESAPVAGRVVEEFSRCAIWLVPGLFVAGVVLAAGILPSVAALSTTYGDLLLTKAGGFSVLMVLATLNKWTYGPLLARGDADAVRGFRLTVAAEYTLIAAVLCVTAAMTTFYSPDE